MKLIKLLIISAIIFLAFNSASAQLPPPPPRPPLPHIGLPKIHLPPHPGTPPRLGGPPAPPTRYKRKHVVRRHYYYRNGVRHYRTY